MALITCLLTGICLIVLGLRAKIPDDPTLQPTSKYSEQARRVIVTGIGMAAVLVALYLLGHGRV